MSMSTVALQHIDLPALLVTGNRISFANAAAQSLLGAHILGSDIRLALRNPEALDVIHAANGTRFNVSGLSVPGSIWALACHRLDEQTRLVTLEDRSVAVGVARAHADFVANASHELRTPLASILGYVETLQDPKAGSDPGLRDRFLSIIGREAQRMQALVEDLMSLSRIEAVKHDTPSDPVNMVRLAQAAASEAGDAAHVRYAGNVEEAMVAGDRAQLEQVLRNLVDNARKYGKPGGDVSITLEATATGWVTVSVADQGEGIAPEHLPRLTERFYRADASRSRQAGGTGLGLSIVKHIVERHRGRFDIASRLGDGTTATIMLPLLRQQ